MTLEQRLLSALYAMTGMVVLTLVVAVTSLLLIAALYNTPPRILPAGSKGVSRRVQLPLVRGLAFAEYVSACSGPRQRMFEG